MSQPAQPSYTEVVDRLVAVTSERDGLLQILRELGASEGDASLVHQLAIWRAEADKRGTRQVLAERALRALQQHWPEVEDEIRAWLQGTNRAYVSIKRKAS